MWGIGAKSYRPIKSSNFIDLDFIEEKMADNNKAKTAPGVTSEETGALEAADEDDQSSEHAECVEEMVFQQLVAPPENE